ncbi:MULTISPECIES: DUF7331 family protein [Haloarcula]|uniref:DUF7331 family protein n=1 Tax=Haloarcula TaxID=2237 RepID=UPI0023E88F36|nr:hypothetical protein [Halomicroarcula sp. SHR3]
MPTRPTDTDEGLAPVDADSFDRYSHLKTDSSEIIYDTESDNAWVQADSAVLLDEWR